MQPSPKRRSASSGCDAAVQEEVEGAPARARGVGGISPLVRRSPSRREARETAAASTSLPAGARRRRAPAAGIRAAPRQTRQGGLVAAYDVVDVGELEAEGPGGMVRKVRRALDAKAFGFNYFIFPPNQEGREHEHGDSNLEEVYIVVKGTGTMRIDGEHVDLHPGRFVRVDPAATR
ncbi:MAG: cupin domain-containing protein, partial [Actinobacteria bacterium]